MESVAKGDCKLSPSASAKKLKQTRLPFQVSVLIEIIGNHLSKLFCLTDSKWITGGLTRSSKDHSQP